MEKFCRGILISAFFFIFSCFAGAQTDWFSVAFADTLAKMEAAYNARNVRKSGTFVRLFPHSHIVCQGDTCVLEADVSAYGPGTDIRYTWTRTSSGTVLGEERSRNNRLIYKPTMEGEYQIALTVEDDGTEIGCDTVMIYVTHKPDYAPIVYDSVCYGDEATIGTAGEGTYWAWSTGGTSQYINIRPGETTVYPFRVSNYPVLAWDVENRCYAQDSSWVVVFDSAQFIVKGAIGICKGGVLDLEVVGGFDVVWNGIPGEAENSFTVNADTLLRVTATDRFGCRDTKLKQISIIERPEGEILVFVDDELSDSVCLGREIRLEAYSEMADRFRWFTRETTSSITVIPKVNFPAYCYFYVGEDNSCYTRVEKEIFVENCNRVFFPTGFMPDGLNRIYSPIGIQDSARQYFFAIFNRNGTMVFSSADYGDDWQFSQGWDGNFKGSPVPSGVYVFIFRETYEQLTWTQRGTISLIR